MIDVARARELAASAVERALASGAEQAEALVAATDSALTRFAGNRIHQNVASEDVEVQVRAVIGQQVGVASSNRSDEAGLAALSTAAVDAARHAPADPRFPGLPEGRPVITDGRAASPTVGFDAHARAQAAAALIGPTAEAGGVAAGSVSRRYDVVAIANSRGVDSAMPRTVLRSTILSTSSGGGTGWASYSCRDADEFDPAALGARAADISRRSSDPVELPPGDYTVLLAPEAVADLALFIAWYGCSAKSVEEGRSFMSGRIGTRVTSEGITLYDDAYSPKAIGLTFDYEGQPKQRVALIEDGVAVGPVTDSYWAALTGRPNTGHALPAPNAQGPMPLDVEISPGTAPVSDMIRSVQRGIYVTRFHYVNIEDPTTVSLTGMTRDGTFLIENGEMTRPVRDFRFTQPALEALDTTLAISEDRELVGEDGAAYVPYLLLEKFAFTGAKG